MDIKDSYLHGTVGVVKSISVSADKLKYKLADIAGTVKEVTLPVATQTANGLLSKEDKKKLDNMIATKVANDLILKIDSGTTEGTSLYTYNGSATKTLDIKSGTGIAFSKTAGALQIFNSGVRSIATGTTNGTISVNTNGTSANVAVKGLGSAAYTNSNAYVRNLGTSSTESTKTDLNTLNTNAFKHDHRWDNAPTGVSIASVANFAFQNDWKSQLLFYHGTQKIFFRDYNGTKALWSSWKQLAFTDSNITGNAASADKLKTKRKLWGQDFDGSADVSGLITIGSDLKTNPSIKFYQGEYFDGYGNFVLTAGASWNVMANGTYLLQVRKNGNIGIGIANNTASEKLEVGGNVKATSFIGNLDGTYVNKLTGYSKATSASNLATTDTLNTALGKLEYKAHYAYDWVIGVTKTDTDEYINKWGEIVGFLDSVKEGTDILDEFVTRKTAQIITGSKTFTATTNTFSGTGASILTIDRNSTNPAWIRFCKNGTLQGYIGITNDFQPAFLSGESGASYKILIHSGNYTSYVNSTNFPGLNKVGTVTSVTVTGSNGLSGSGTVTTSGTITLSNAGVRSATINGDYLRVNTNGTNADLTIPYATQAKSLKHTTLTSGQDLNTLTTEGVYSHTQTPVCNSLVNGPTGRSNGECRLEVINCGSSSHSLQWLYTKAGKQGEIWYRMGTSNSTWSTWNKIAFISNIPTSLKNPYTLTFSAGTFAAKTYDGSVAVTVNVPTKTSHLTNDSGYLTSRGYIGTTAVQSTSKAQALTGITNLTMSGNLTITPGNTDNFINFSYNGGSTYSWRLGYLGTGSGDTNYFVVQSAKAAGTSWNNVIRLGNETLDAAFGGNVYPLVTNTQTLGTSSLRWANVYAVNGSFLSNVVSTTTTGDAVKHAVTNSNGSVELLVHSNRGLYDRTNNKWIIYVPKDTTNVWVPIWASKGSSTQPVYFDKNGNPVACTAYSGLFTAFTTNSTKISATIGGTTLTVQAPSIAYYSHNTEAASSSTNPTVRFEGTKFGTNTGMYMTANYNDPNTPCGYGNIINLIGSGGGQLLCGWEGFYKTGNLYYRSHRDNLETGGWTPWKQVAFTDSNISGSAAKLTSTTVVSAKALSLSNASWTDTSYTFASLASGTYAVQVTSGSNLVASGIMSVYKNLSDTAGDEIPLHVYGTAGWRPYLRTYNNKLQISSNDASATSRTVTIKIAQIL